MGTTVRRPAPARRDPADPVFKTVERAQRGRMIVDVATLDLAAAEAALGPFHEVAWHFRRALADARDAWDRLRARCGAAALEDALAEPPVTVLTLGDDAPGVPLAVLIPIAGRTYRAERLEPTPLAPSLWRLTRLVPPPDDGPYHAARLADGSTRCDCAEWIYQVEDVEPPGRCKHLAALEALGWL